MPEQGPVIFAANHRSFLDPFIVGCLTRRPVYYVAKRELFRRPLTAWFLNSLGAFPVDRGASDPEMLETARRILDRGDALVIFPRPGRLRPRVFAVPARELPAAVAEGRLDPERWAASVIAPGPAPAGRRVVAA